LSDPAAPAYTTYKRKKTFGKVLADSFKTEPDTERLGFRNFQPDSFKETSLIEKDGQTDMAERTGGHGSIGQTDMTISTRLVIPIKNIY